MADDLTHGFDMVFEFTPEVLNNYLPAVPFPDARGHADIPLGPVTLSFDYQVWFTTFGRDLISFDTSIADGLAIETEFSLELTNVTISPLPSGTIPDTITLNGTIRVHHPISTYTNALGRRCVGIDFTSLPLGRVDVEITDETGLPLPEDDVERALENLLHAQLVNNVGQLTAFQMPAEADENPITPDAFDVRVMTDDCAALLMSTTPDTTGRRDEFTSCDMPPGADSSLILSSETLIMHLICPAVLDWLELEGDPSLFFSYADGAAELNAPTSLSHLVDHSLVDAIGLRGMRIFVEGNALQLSADLAMNGFGYAATARLVASVELSIDDEGDLVIDYAYDVTEVDLFIYPWVWVLIALGIAVVPVIGGIIAIVLPILPFVVDPIVERLVDYLVGEEGTVEVPGLPIEIDAVLLDDLKFTGRAVPPERAPEPRPSVWIEVETETGDPTDFSTTAVSHAGGAVLETRTTYDLSNEVRCVGETQRMVFPVEYSWTLDDVPLAGEGTVTIGESNVTYAVDGRRCVLSLDAGTSLYALLKLRAVASNAEDTDERLLDIKGRTEMRSFHGVEKLQGSSVLEFLNEMTAVPEELDVPDLGYVDDWRSYVEASVSDVPARTGLVTEMRAALMRGTGIKIREDEFF